MPVTYLIWNAPLVSQYLAAARTDSTVLHTGMMLAAPEGGQRGEWESRADTAEEEKGLF